MINLVMLALVARLVAVFLVIRLKDLVDSAVKTFTLILVTVG